MKNIIIITWLLACNYAIGQVDSSEFKKLDFTGDFRFRVERDWDSQNSRGDMRDDRDRIRYRFRFGLNYTLDQNSSFGGRIRSGNINDQQGPHVTIGGDGGEFELVKVGLEKLFYKYKSKHFSGWVGKHSIPLVKLNEMFWNDNVFPEGIGLNYKWNFKVNKSVNGLAMNVGHFIIESRGKTFSEDSYLQVVQLNVDLLQQRLKIFPGFYYFKAVGNLPDKKGSYNLDYAILHIGGQVVLDKNRGIKIGIESYNNLQDYAQTDSIPNDFRNQTQGYVLETRYGNLKKKGDWMFYLSFANLQKYSIVDYFAQNDWARWDYSSEGAAGSRISNFQGVEIRTGYAINEKFNLVLKTYFVEQLLKTGDFLENGNRIRLDLNIGF